MERKLIFLDIDGTLTLPGASAPPPSAQDAVQQARARGHRVFLCTGRNWMMTQPLMAFGFDGAVCSAGGYIRCGQQVIYDHPMSPDLLARTRAVLEQAGIAYALEAKDAVFNGPGMVEGMLRSAGTGSEALRWKQILSRRDRVRSTDAYDGRGIYKVVFIAPDAQSVERAEQALERDFFVCRQSFFGNGGTIQGELIHRAFDKGTAVARVRGHLGVPAEDTVAFGDSMNDLAMLRAAGTAVRMEGGDPALQACCALVCPAAARDGLAWAFQALGLIGPPEAPPGI